MHVEALRDLECLPIALPITFWDMVFHRTWGLLFLLDQLPGPQDSPVSAPQHRTCRLPHQPLVSSGDPHSHSEVSTASTLLSDCGRSPILLELQQLLCVLRCTPPIPLLNLMFLTLLSFLLWYWRAIRRSESHHCPCVQCSTIGNYSPNLWQLQLLSNPSSPKGVQVPALTHIQMSIVSPQWMISWLFFNSVEGRDLTLQSEPGFGNLSLVGQVWSSAPSLVISFLNKVLLEHTHVHSLIYHQWLCHPCVNRVG